MAADRWPPDPHRHRGRAIVTAQTPAHLGSPHPAPGGPQQSPQGVRRHFLVREGADRGLPPKTMPGAAARPAAAPPAIGQPGVRGAAQRRCTPTASPPGPNRRAPIRQPSRQVVAGQCRFDPQGHAGRRGTARTRRYAFEPRRFKLPAWPGGGLAPQPGRLKSGTLPGLAARAAPVPDRRGCRCDGDPPASPPKLPSPRVDPPGGPGPEGAPAPRPRIGSRIAPPGLRATARWRQQGCWKPRRAAGRPRSGAGGGADERPSRLPLGRRPGARSRTGLSAVAGRPGAWLAWRRVRHRDVSCAMQANSALEDCQSIHATILERRSGDRESIKSGSNEGVRRKVRTWSAGISSCARVRTFRTDGSAGRPPSRTDSRTFAMSMRT